ncbi:endonuclease domain-containing 1 protein-like [Emydura macquarii macquarii]|uniref:endonuclease domain-containing 1 protein-like n=1 Tax=Emydura macquarii macquarii TaxID=1129001 RepID=UPI00352B0A61
MGPLALLGFASLWAGLALAEVVSNFSKCNEYFYKGTEPKGFDDQNRAKICQQYSDKHNFATFYDKKSRIPVWSAYTMLEENCPETERKVWMVEPQLSGAKETNMKKESDVLQNLKTSQAVNADYNRIGYDRGHLNPNSFHCGEGRTATFTLTNAVPKDPCFNRIRWYELERNLQQQLKEKCINLDGKPFLITGAVPHPKYKIPIKDNRGNSNRDAGRVVVPSHIWTAVCCNHSNNNKKFSFAFLGINKPGSTLNAMQVTELNNELKNLYKRPSIEIFIDDCNKDSPKSAEVLKEITKELHSSFPHWVNE